VTKRGRPVARVVPLASNKPNALRGFIVATARAHDAILVTADDRIPESGLVRCVWD
jgi:antitoxin (DNA-binding transcriptional repressor) of toxin-antitoxin stability system